MLNEGEKERKTEKWRDRQTEIKLEMLLVRERKNDLRAESVYFVQRIDREREIKRKRDKEKER